MSEMKAINLNSMGCYNINEPVYLKSEADKVIAEKDKEIARLDDLAHAHNIELLRKENLIEELKKKEVLLGKTLNTISESHKHVVSLARKCNHVNYKRCLAMAKWCDEVMMSCELRGYTVHRIWCNRHQWAMRWKYKWLELAEKFKPNNSTAQRAKENK